jgi:phosphoribosylformylglycinamidine cyclo-ligase
MVFFDHLGLSVETHVDELNATVADELLRVHRSYLKPVEALAGIVTLKGMAHITGGGVVENLPRILPSGCAARIEVGTWTEPRVFRFLAEQGDIPDVEMYRVFNMGLGMLVVVSRDEANAIPDEAGDLAVHRVGEIVGGDRHVEVVPGSGQDG